MSEISSKGATNRRWTSSRKSLKNYDAIFGKKEVQQGLEEVRDGNVKDLDEGLLWEDEATQAKFLKALKDARERIGKDKYICNAAVVSEECISPEVRQVINSRKWGYPNVGYWDAPRRLRRGTRL